MLIIRHFWTKLLTNYNHIFHRLQEHLKTFQKDEERNAKGLYLNRTIFETKTKYFQTDISFLVIRQNWD
jgi:hypothetical protein